MFSSARERGREREGKGTREAPTNGLGTMCPNTGCRLPNARKHALPDAYVCDGSGARRCR